jgi:septal ring factor EnvC (AmiA/AmiB activator)
MWHPLNRLKELLTAEVKAEAFAGDAEMWRLQFEALNREMALREDKYAAKIANLEAALAAERESNRDRENLLVDRVLTKAQAYGITEPKEVKKIQAAPEESDREKLLEEWFVEDYLEQMNWPPTAENVAIARKQFPKYKEGGFGINPIDIEM